MFPSCLKFADAIPLHKKRRKDAKQSYRSVSILLAVSKPFERNMFKQVSSFFQDVFSKHQCDFRTGFSTRQCFLVFSEKWKVRSINVSFLVLYWSIFLKHLTASRMNFYCEAKRTRFYFSCFETSSWLLITQ